jgi:YHS domain-containing protein
MKRNYISLIIGLLAVMIGVFPVFAQQETAKEDTVSRPQEDASPYIEAPAKSSALLGIPSTLVAVHYRRCPIDGQRLKKGSQIVFGGKAYRFCCKTCVEKFWENPQSVALTLKNNQETPLTILNQDGICFACEKPASREFCRQYRETIAFFCSSACRAKTTKSNRTTVSRPQKPEIFSRQ